MTSHAESRPRIVLGFAGHDHDASALAALRQRHEADIIAVTVDLGQGVELESVRDRALALGVLRAHVLDLREEFACDFILPALKAGALLDESHDTLAALAPPLIASGIVQIADIERATAVAHGCRGVGLDRERLEESIRALNSQLRIFAPQTEAGASQPRSETREVEPISVGVPSKWRGAVVAASKPPDDVFVLTRSASVCPDEPAAVEVQFDRGMPTAVNGVAMPLLDLIQSLNTIAGTHGVGRLDLRHHRGGDGRTRVTCEAPAAMVLTTAHRDLQHSVSPAEVNGFSHTVGQHYVDLIQRGQWHGSFRLALASFIEAVQQRVTGTVRIKLFKGHCEVIGRTSPFIDGTPVPRPGSVEEAAAARLASVATVPAGESQDAGTS